MILDFRKFDRRPFHSTKTGSEYFFVRADAFVPQNKTAEQIASICGHPSVYNAIFFEAFKGKPYTSESARFFIQMIQEGWKSGAAFHFLVITADHEVIGTVGIKSHDAGAGEIGYWTSPLHSGIASKALEMLCAEAAQAGINSLYAYVKPNNSASIRVLEKNSFERDPHHERKDRDVLLYRKTLAN